MSDEGEKTCPLCAEEMDLTDQQLKPCKCGYEICVWCWHHIMDMAEKDNTEGRCPACRSSYNKEKIVGTASKCERLLSGMSVEKKLKSQKGKIKTSEGRKQLGSVRVIQRNLVYVVGLPLNLADEDLLQQKDFFGQYGKVLKVSISRTAAGAIQQFPNNTCSVYITYSKEEEAVRSIQSAHGFVLDGRPLRACFGTTKYCHAWLRNAPCTNADCLYLHEFGPQEDSFTKDEIISAYTRNRVQQITGATNGMQQRRSGNLLPPPADDYSNNSTSSWGKPISKSISNNPANGMKISPPNSSSGRSVALPAAASWGTRTSTSPPFAANTTSSNGPSKQQPEAHCTTLPFPTAVTSPSVQGKELLKKHNEESHGFQEKPKLDHSVSVKKVTGTDHRRTISEIPCTTSPKDKNVISSNTVPNFSSSSTVTRRYSNPSLDDDPNEADQLKENAYLISDLQKKVAEIAISEAEQDLPSFNNERLKDTEANNHPTNSFSYSKYSSNGSLGPPFTDQSLIKAHESAFDIPVVNGYSSSLTGNSSSDSSSGNSYFLGTEDGRRQMGIFEEATSIKGDRNAASDLGESSIISNILSMDFDPWDESLSSPQNLAKLLGESDQKLESNRVLSSRKVQSSNQSRFSFARQDDCVDQGSSFTSNLSEIGQNLNPDLVGNNNIYLDNKLSNGNGFSSFSFEGSDCFATSYSSMSENKFSVSRAQVSAPPGFSGLGRAPPPGFMSHERMEQPFDNLSGNNMFDTSLFRKSYQATSPVNISSVKEMELMDPAILAVGGPLNVPSIDTRSNFPSRLNSFENDTRLQLLMQTSFSQQNPRDNFPQQNFQNHFSGFQSSVLSNSHWENDIAMAELLRNERMGFNRYYSGQEDTKFRRPSSGNLYNRTFGM